MKKSLPKRSRYVVFPRALEVEVRDEPRPRLKADQVLVRARRGLISTGTEMTLFIGEYPKGSAWAAYGKFPVRPGYSTAGDVVQVGKQANSAARHAGLPDLKRGQAVMTPAGHREVFAISPAHCHPIPRGVSHEEASFRTLGEIVMGGIRRSRIELGECVVVFGLGLLGQLACQMARLCGARPVVAVDVAPGRLALAKKLGAHATRNPKRKDLRKEISALTGGRMADVVIEVTGHPAVIPGQLKLLRREGRLVVLGSPRGPSTVDFHDEVHTLGLHVIGAHNSTHPQHEQPLTPWTRKRDGDLFFALIRAREVLVKPLISHRYRADRAPEAFRMLHEDRSQAMGVILKWD